MTPLPPGKTGNEGRLPSDVLVDEFVNYLRSGNPISVACGITGINSSAVSRWRGEAKRRAKPREWCIEFNRRVTEAMAYAQASHLQIITKAAAAGDVSSAKWYLERSNPENWSIAARVQLEVFDGDDDGMDSRGKLDAVIAAMEDLEDLEVIDATASEESEDELQSGSEEPATGGA